VSVRRYRLLLAVVLALAIVATAQAFLLRTPARSRSSEATSPLRTGVVDAWSFSGSGAGRAFEDVRRLGARYTRFYVDWKQIAPKRLLVDEAVDPGNASYEWQSLDDELKRAVAHGLTPILDVLDAPDWARVGVYGNNDNPLAPRLDDLAAFAKAAATRYDGHFGRLPRVRYWQVWNEPNLDVYLMPQRQSGNPVSPEYYRSMVTAFAGAVKGVDASNLVVAGGLSPFRQMTGIAPLEFTRDLFCLGPDLKPTCDAKVPVDIWAVHPYSWGGPTWKAQVKDDLSLGDLPALRKTLDAAVAAGHVVSAGKLGLWATEFSWGSDPPERGAVPMAVLTRWIPEALHQMWLNGISDVIWFSLYDRPPDEFYHSGLYFQPAASGVAKPKPAAVGFRFPFVAYPKKRDISFWGRTPTSKAGIVTISVRKSGRWKVVARVRANGFGIFSGTIKKAPAWAFARAQAGTSLSASFAAKAPPTPKFTKLF
jgi:hypothetical protein